MTDLEGAVERVVWRWQDEPITSLSHGERLEWYLGSPVFDRAGPFSTKDEAEAVNAARAGLKITLEQFARLLEPRDWEEFDRIGDRYGFFYDKIYASMRSALRILTAWSPEVLDLRDRAVKAETALASITRENERLRLLILGGEDAPGVAAYLSFEEIERLHKDAVSRHQDDIDTILAMEAALTSDEEPNEYAPTPRQRALDYAIWATATYKSYREWLERATKAEAERDAMREGLKVAQAYALPTLNGIIESNVNAEIIAAAQADKDLIAALVNGEVGE